MSFAAIGCLEIPLPPNTHAETTDSEMVVRCLNTDQSWTLKCIGTKWIGTVGQCTVPTSILPYYL